MKKLIEIWRLLAQVLMLLVLAACGAVPEKSAPVASAEIQGSARNSFMFAVAAMQAQQWGEAERQLQELIRSQPQLSGAYLNLALICAQTNRAIEAENQFKKAIDVNADNMMARNQYGIWLRTQGRFKEAEMVYLQALQLHADHADTHLNLGILYDLYFGRSAQALEHYQHYLRLNGDSADAGRVRNWVADLQRRSKDEA